MNVKCILLPGDCCNNNNEAPEVLKQKPLRNIRSKNVRWKYPFGQKIIMQVGRLRERYSNKVFTQSKCGQQFSNTFCINSETDNQQYIF